MGLLSVYVEMNTKREARSPLFAERLNRLRRSGNWTFEALGKRVGVSGTLIYYWEKGKTYPKAGDLEKLAAALGTSVAVLTQIEDAVGTEKEIADDAGQSTLTDVVEASRQRIAEAARLPVQCVRVIIDRLEVASDLPEDDRPRSV